MATDAYSGDDAEVGEAGPSRPGRAQQIDYDSRIAPTCMMWCIAGGLGTLIVAILVWIISEVGKLDWSKLL